jgi:serine protease DegQ
VATAVTTADIPSIVRQLEPSIVTVYVGQGLGSGIVYKADGVIVTNQHVVGDAKQVAIGFADGQRVPGQVLATDPVTDLAVVRVSRTGLPAARFETALPAVGELAIALGSPLGFANTATAGIISGLGRAIPAEGAQGQPLVDLIQTDAAISPGNSGGRWWTAPRRSSA